MSNKDYENNIPDGENKYMTEEEVRNLIATSLANWTGVTRFRTIESTVLTLTDFTSSQHNHSNAAGGGQLVPTTCFTTTIPVSVGGSGATTLTGILKGNGTSPFTAIVPLSGTGTFYAAATSGGAVNVKFDYDSGVITART